MSVTLKSVLTRELESGKLYYTIGDERKLLTKCKPVIEAYEDTKKLKLRGSGIEYNVKCCHMVLAVCGDMDFTVNVDIPFLEKISSFSADFSYTREDGVMECIKLHNIPPREIDLNGKWTFDITDYTKEIRKLFPDLIFD